MTAASIIASLAGRGVEVQLDGQNLRVKALKGSVDESDKSLLQEKKEILVRHLSEERLVPSEDAGSSLIFKSYRRSDGGVDQYTKEEFEAVVQLIGLLWEMKHLNN